MRKINKGCNYFGTVYYENESEKRTLTNTFKRSVLLPRHLFCLCNDKLKVSSINCALAFILGNKLLLEKFFNVSY